MKPAEKFIIKDYIPKPNIKPVYQDKKATDKRTHFHALVVNEMWDISVFDNIF